MGLRERAAGGPSRQREARAGRRKRERRGSSGEARTRSGEAHAASREAVGQRRARRSPPEDWARNPPGALKPKGALPSDGQRPVLSSAGARPLGVHGRGSGHGTTSKTHNAALTGKQPPPSSQWGWSPVRRSQGPVCAETAKHQVALVIWSNCPRWGSKATCTGGGMPRCGATCKPRPALARISCVRKLSIVNWHIQSADTHCHRAVTLRTLLVIIIDQLECDVAGRPGGGLRGSRAC